MHRDAIDETTAIRRRADGSIDTDFYLDRGRKARSKAAHESASRARGFIADWLRGLTGARRRVAVKCAG